MNKLVKYGLQAAVILIVAASYYAYGRHNGVFEGYELAQKAANYRPVTPAATPSFTGMDVWNEINRHRKSQGLKTWVLSDELCNNITTRFQQIEKNYGHDGYLEFAQEQERQRLWTADKVVAELIAEGNSPSSVVNGWDTSPSHSLSLNSPSHTEACVHAWNGKVLLFVR